MSSPIAAETFEAHGCRVVCRRFDGPVARELHLLAEPLSELSDTRAQAEAVYRAVAEVIAAHGGSADAAVTQSVFLRSMRDDLAPARAGLAAAIGELPHAATTEIEQPPLAENARLAVALHAAVPMAAPPRVDTFEARTDCRCDACAHASAQRYATDDETRLHVTGLHGVGEDAYAQSLAMFELAESLLEQAGMTFHDVARTWIHLREMERDYDALNRARRAFFAERGIAPPPASTGIGGAPASEPHDLCLGLYAHVAANGPGRTMMTTPTLNEAPVYGSDFARGMKVVEANKTALYVSGTASIDERGDTVHVGDIDAQADRMLVNVSTLLDGQRASFNDIVSGITYVKDPADAPRLRARLREAGFDGFPNAVVAAEVCRPELLCETEVLAVLPHGASTDRPSEPAPTSS